MNGRGPGRGSITRRTDSWLVIFAVLVPLVSGCKNHQAGAPAKAVRSGTEQQQATPSPNGIRTQAITMKQGDVRRTVNLKVEPIVDGCSMEGAMKTLSSRHDHVRICAKEYAKRQGKLPEGRVVLALRLKKSGEVAQSVLTVDPVGEEEFGACLKEAVMVKFPNPFQKRCIVQAPFEFRGTTAPANP